MWRYPVVTPRSLFTFLLIIFVLQQERFKIDKKIVLFVCLFFKREMSIYGQHQELSIYLSITSIITEDNVIMLWLADNLCSLKVWGALAEWCLRFKNRSLPQPTVAACAAGVLHEEGLCVHHCWGGGVGVYSLISWLWLPDAPGTAAACIRCVNRWKPRAEIFTAAKGHREINKYTVQRM